ncbi:MAG: YceI family protein [Gemmatimonadaceae bacterium]
MRRHTTRAATLLLCLAPAAVAFRTAATTLTLEEQSRIWIAGTSTVRAFTCEAPQFDAAIEAAAPGAVGALLSGEKAVSTATLKVSAAKLDCGNGTMNGHMAKALKSSEFPTITFVLGGYAPAKTATGIAGTIDGQLTLGGVTKPITLKATAKDEGGALRVQGVYDLDMTEYGIKPPSLMMGTMKVGKVAKVNFDLVIKG